MKKKDVWSYEFSMPAATKFQFNPFYKPWKNHVTNTTLNLTTLKAPQLASPHLNHRKQH